MSKPHSYIQPLSVRARESRPQPKGLPVINLSFNELAYPPSQSVLDAISTSTANANRYGNPACDELRLAIADANDINSEQIICGNGSEELLDIIGRVFARPGDEIVAPEYGYIQFPIVANRVGATLIKAPEADFTTDVDALLAAVSDKTRLMFLANPNNPTSTMVSSAELLRLAESVPEHVVLVIDLAYGEFAGRGYCRKVHALVDQFNNVIVTRTFSKAYGLAGLRVGWCHTPLWMQANLYAARGMGTANAAGQAGAIASIADSRAVYKRVHTVVDERNALHEELENIGMNVIPGSANFLMASIKGADAEAAEALASYLFDDAGILVNKTREAGLEQFIRFSMSKPEHQALLRYSVERFINNGRG